MRSRLLSASAVRRSAKAQDEESDAIFDLAGFRTADPKTIAKKQKIAIDLQRERPWLDGRDLALLQSIRRDLQAMNRLA